MGRSKAEIMSELTFLRQRLEKLEQLFNLSDNDDDTESIIYEEKAVQLRYSKVLREAKDEKISVASGRED